MDRRDLLDRYEARGDEADFSSAKSLYEEALVESPDDPRLLNEYGYLLECHGRLAVRAATAAYRRAIEIDPDWPKPRFQLMSASAALGEPDEAIEEYRDKLAAAPRDPSAYRLLASAYLVARRYAEAGAIAREGLASAPDDGQLTDRLGEALAGEGRIDEAIAVWRRGYELDPDALDGRYGSAFALEKAGRLREARDEWRFIRDWSIARGNDLDAEWPAREIVRLESRIGG